MNRTFAIFWFLICTIVGVVGIYLAANQHRKLAQFLPVQATVQSAEVESRWSRSHPGERRSTSYFPVVHYEYLVEGRAYTSKLVFPLNVGRGSGWGQRWAREVVKQFENGQQTTAYYDPRNPDESFLLKQPSVIPYAFILLPTILGLVGLAGFRSTDQPTPMPVPAKRRKALTVAAAWHGVGLLCAGHYFTLAGSDYEDFAVPIFGVYTLLGLIPLIVALPDKGWGGRLKAAGAFSLIGAFLGFWGGLLAGWLAALLSSQKLGGPSWVWYGVLVGAGLFALLGLFGGEVESH